MAKQKPKLPKFKVGDKVQVRGEEPSYSFTVGQVSVVHGKKGKRFFYEPRPGSIYSFAEKTLKRVKAIPLAPAPAPAVSGNLPEPEAAEAHEVWRIAKWRRRMGQVPSSRIAEYVPEKVATLYSKSEAVLFLIGKRKLEDDTVEYGIYQAYKPGEFPGS